MKKIFLRVLLNWICVRLKKSDVKKTSGDSGIEQQAVYVGGLRGKDHSKSRDCCLKKSQW